jgi:hypothetical protein
MRRGSRIAYGSNAAFNRRDKPASALGCGSNAGISARISEGAGIKVAWPPPCCATAWRTSRRISSMSSSRALRASRSERALSFVPGLSSRVLTAAAKWLRMRHSRDAHQEHLRGESPRRGAASCRAAFCPLQQIDLGALRNDSGRVYHLVAAVIMHLDWSRCTVSAIPRIW